MKINKYYIAVSLIVAQGVAHGAIVYQDNFDGDTLAVNTGVGGGSTNNTISVHAWADDTAVDGAEFVATGTNFQRRALMFTDSAFSVDQGFTLTFDYTTSGSNAGASELSFGLVSTGTNIATYTGFNPFDDDATVEGLGFTLAQSNQLTIGDGTVQTALANPAGLINVGSSVVELTVDAAGAWSYTIDGGTAVTGVSTFDLTKDYRIVTYGQDDQLDKLINSITLDTVVPEPSSTALLAFGAVGSLCLRRRKQA